MDQDLTWSRLQSRLLYEMDLMLRVIESGNVCVTGKFLARFQDSKLRVIQDFARVVNVRICE